jgi:hypothetical protein
MKEQHKAHADFFSGKGNLRKNIKCAVYSALVMVVVITLGILQLFPSC